MVLSGKATIGLPECALAKYSKRFMTVSETIFVNAADGSNIDIAAYNIFTDDI
jgi:hypothetical protein